MKPKVVYLMHIPWRWIKQRPHFMAVELAKYFKVTVIARPSKDKIDSTSYNDFTIKSTRSIKDNFFSKIYNYVMTILWLNYCCIVGKTKYLFITDPRLIKFYKRIYINRPRLIYDCMDNTFEFQEIQKSTDKQKIFLGYEQYAIKTADFVIASSQTLKNIMCLRYGVEYDKKILVVNNALDEDFIHQHAVSQPFSELCLKFRNAGNKIIIYSGTIDSWLQFDWLRQLIRGVPNIVVILIGPNVANFSSDDDRIVLFGTLEHCYLCNALRNADAFIMPFKINKLIESVDPVKVYEYLVLKKPILLPYYAELDKFTSYHNIHFYTTFVQFEQTIRELLSGEIKNDEALFNINDFIYNNSWQTRVDMLYSRLI